MLCIKIINLKIDCLSYRKRFHISATATRIPLGVWGVEEREANRERHRLCRPRRSAAAPTHRQCGGYRVSHKSHSWRALVRILSTDGRRAGQRLCRLHVCHAVSSTHPLWTPRCVPKLLCAPSAVPYMPLGDSRRHSLFHVMSSSKHHPSSTKFT